MMTYVVVPMRKTHGITFTAYTVHVEMGNNAEAMIAPEEITIITPPISISMFCFLFCWLITLLSLWHLVSHATGICAEHINILVVGFHKIPFSCYSFYVLRVTFESV